MIPLLHDKSGNKLGALSFCILGITTEERNGMCEIEIDYLIQKDMLWDKLINENIIVADVNDTLKNQKFRIYKVSKAINKRIKVFAKHISYDLEKDLVESIDIQNQSCEYALNTIFRNSQFSQHYRGYSDIINAQDFSIDTRNVLSAIGGKEGSILDTYGTGAEILRDNENIHVLNRRGHDNSVSIEYGKNLTGFTCDEDMTGLCTRIKGFAKSKNAEGDEIIINSLPKFVDSIHLNKYATPYIQEIDFTEKFKEGEEITGAKIKNLAEKHFRDSKCDIPKMNYKIDFIPLSKCVGFENLEDKISLCDTVTIKNSIYNISTQAKVIKSKYNFLADRMESLELGEPKTSLGDIVGGGGNDGKPGPPGQDGKPGADGNIGDFPDNLPAIPTLSSKVYGFANIELTWTFENKVYYSYELYASKTENFTPNTFNLIFEGQASTFLFQAKPSEIWYFRACAVNSHGNRTEFSTQVKVETTKIDDLSNYVANAAIGDALIGELNLGRGWFGELRGNYIDAKQLSVTDGNGKRTLDIDSFGNVNLDVTTLKIRSNNVATENKVTEELNKYKVLVDKEFTDVSTSIKNLETLSNDIFFDNVVTVAEKEALKKQKAILEKEHKDVLGQVEALEIVQELLNTIEKSNLISKKTELITAYNSLISILDNLITVATNTSTDFNNSINSYNIKLKELRILMQKCVDKIASIKANTVDTKYSKRCSAIEQDATKIKESVTETQKTATSALEKATTAETTVNGVKTTVTEVSKKVDTTVTKVGQLELEVDNMELSFDSKLEGVGGQNYVKNSEFASKDLSSWGNWNNATLLVYGNNIQSGHDQACKITTTRTNQGLEQQISGLTVDEWYTVSCRMYSEGGVHGLSVRNSGVWNGNHIQAPQRVWTTVHFTFQAKEITTWLYVGNVNSSCRNGITWVTGIQLRKGKALLDWIPNTNEMYSANYKFDKEGLKGKFEDGTYAEMGRKGFVWYSSGNMSHAYHCLTKSGMFNVASHGNGNWTEVKIQLPGYFKNKYFEPTCSISGWVIGGFTIDTLTATIKSYDIVEGSFIIQIFGYTQAGGYFDNINVSWTVNA